MKLEKRMRKRIVAGGSSRVTIKALYSAKVIIFKPFKPLEETQMNIEIQSKIKRVKK